MRVNFTLVLLSAHFPDFRQLSSVHSIYSCQQKFCHLKAKNAYQKGLTFNPEKSIYYRLALLYDFKLKDEKNALTYYKLYLKSKPDAVKNKTEMEYVKNRLAKIEPAKKL